MSKPNRPGAAPKQGGKPPANAAKGGQKAAPKPAARAAHPAPQKQGPQKSAPKSAPQGPRGRQQNSAHSASVELDEGEELVRQLSALAVAMAGAVKSGNAPVDQDGERIGQQDLDRLIRKCLRGRDDESLYEALEQVRFEDRGAWSFLRQAIEDAAQILVMRRGERLQEINTFMIPLLVRTKGGLQQAAVFQNGDDFEALKDSLQQSGLESARARVVLVAHAYHPEEIEALSYSEVEAMNRDAYTSLTDKKVLSVPAIERSMRGWPASDFAAADDALELRFLLGFSLKELDDPFYVVPTDEAKADAYFEQRAERFRAWSEKNAPLLQRCLSGSSAPDACQVHFMYQDLFFGGKQTGNAEYRTLQMLSELEQGLAAAQAAAADAMAVFALASEDDETGDWQLTVQLRARDDQRLLAQSLQVLDGDPDEQLLDVADAVASLGVTQSMLAEGLDDAGQPRNMRPFGEL
jgi:hypothetical protein